MGGHRIRSCIWCRIEQGLCTVKKKKVLIAAISKSPRFLSSRIQCYQLTAVQPTQPIHSERFVRQKRSFKAVEYLVFYSYTSCHYALHSCWKIPWDLSIRFLPLILSLLVLSVKYRQLEMTTVKRVLIFLNSYINWNILRNHINVILSTKWKVSWQITCLFLCFTTWKKKDATFSKMRMFKTEIDFKYIRGL